MDQFNLDTGMAEFNLDPDMAQFDFDKFLNEINTRGDLNCGSDMPGGYWQQSQTFTPQEWQQQQSQFPLSDLNNGVANYASPQQQAFDAQVNAYFQQGLYQPQIEQFPVQQPQQAWGPPANVVVGQLQPQQAVVTNTLPPNFVQKTREQQQRLRAEFEAQQRLASRQDPPVPIVITVEDDSDKVTAPKTTELVDLTVEGPASPKRKYNLLKGERPAWMDASAADNSNGNRERRGFEDSLRDANVKAQAAARWARIFPAQAKPFRAAAPAVKAVLSAPLAAEAVLLAPPEQEEVPQETDEAVQAEATRVATEVSMEDVSFDDWIVNEPESSGTGRELEVEGGGCDDYVAEMEGQMEATEESHGDGDEEEKEEEDKEDEEVQEDIGEDDMVVGGFDDDNFAEFEDMFDEVEACQVDSGYDSESEISEEE